MNLNKEGTEGIRIACLDRLELEVFRAPYTSLSYGSVHSRSFKFSLAL